MIFLISQPPMGVGFDVTIRSLGKKKPDQQARVWMVGERARIEFLTDSEDLKKGDYAITLDGGKSFSIVSVGKKTIERQDSAALQKEADSERDLDIKTATADWNLATPSSPTYSQNLAATVKQGIFRIPATMNILASYTLTPPGSSRPAYNPVVSLIVPGMTSLGLKNKAFRETKGPYSGLPTGFAERAELQVQIKSKLMNDNQRLAIETAPAGPVTVPPDAFTLPTGYKNAVK